MGLSQLNPLFLDSTKPVGDKVVTNVELVNILLRDGDSAYFEMVDQFGFHQRFVMQVVETKKSVKYKAEVWLKYQHEICYRFVIESEGKAILTSASSKTLAGHYICEKWQPSFTPDPHFYKIDQRDLKGHDSKKEARSHREFKSTTTKPLCKPQFIDQIKSLLEDLM